MKYLSIITKIDKAKSCKHWDGKYKMVYFKVFDTDGSTFFARAPVINTFNNFTFWKDLLEEGNILEVGITTIGRKTLVDTDIKPRLVGHERDIGRKGIKQQINQQRMFI